MLRKIIVFLVRRKYGLKKYQYFTFDNQKTANKYYFTSTSIMKLEDGERRPSNVSFNWMTCDKCKITKLNKFVVRDNNN